MATIHLNKGHNINLAGAPKKELKSLPCPKKIRINPDDFKNIKPKLVVKVGDKVKIGQKLFFDKNSPQVFFCSPVSGEILDIKLGNRRKLEYVEISCENNEYLYNQEEIISKDINREQIIEKLLEFGLWPSIRQRPFSKIANPEDTPKSIFVSAMPTAPHAPDLDFVLKDNCDGLNKGIEILNSLTSGDVNIVMDRNKDYTIFKDCENFTSHQFSGPHPAGNTGIHIHHIDPIANRNDKVWYISLQDLNNIGNFFNHGVYPTEKCITVSGNLTPDAAYFTVKKGMLISDILEGIDLDENFIIISGDVLSGSKRSLEAPIGYYHETLSVLPEVKKRDFLGWILPGLKKYSLSRAFLSSLLPKEPTNFDTRINGSRRAIIPFGRWEAMLPMDIMPDFLVKSILAKDIEDMEKYGIYECDDEDFALCAYACQSKVEVSKIIGEGLDFIDKEG